MVALFLNATFEFVFGVFIEWGGGTFGTSESFASDLSLQNEGVCEVEFIIVVGGYDFFEHIFSFDSTLVIIFDLGEVYSNAGKVTIWIPLKHCENVCWLSLAVHPVFFIDKIVIFILTIILYNHLHSIPFLNHSQNQQKLLSTCSAFKSLTKKYDNFVSEKFFLQKSCWNALSACPKFIHMELIPSFL